MDDIDLSNLSPSQGFKIIGAAGDGVGNSVGGAGDVNADGINDVIVGATWASPSGRTRTGAAYVIYGRAPTITPSAPSVIKWGIL